MNYNLLHTKNAYLDTLSIHVPARKHAATLKKIQKASFDYVLCLFQMPLGCTSSISVLNEPRPVQPA